MSDDPFFGRDLPRLQDRVALLDQVLEAVFDSETGAQTAEDIRTLVQGILDSPYRP